MDPFFYLGYYLEQTGALNEHCEPKLTGELVIPCCGGNLCRVFWRMAQG
ncbi:MAG: hypothetical protein ACLTDV_08885 [Eubacterium sp.]